MTWRHLLVRLSRGHDKGPLVLLAVLVLLTTLAATLGVRGLALGSDAALRESIEELPPRAAGMTVGATSAQVGRALTPEVLDRGAERLETAMTAELNAAFDAPTWWISTNNVDVYPPDAQGQARYMIDLRVQGGLADHIRLVEGELPGPGLGPDDAEGPLFEVGVTAHSAETLGLRVGDVLATEATNTSWTGTEFADPVKGRLKVTGIVEVTDPQASYWAQTPTGGNGWIVGLGTDVPEYHGVGFLAPEAAATLSRTDIADRPAVGWWITTSGADVSAAQASTLAADVRQFATAAPRLSMGIGLSSTASVSAAGLERLFEQFAAGRAALGAPLAVAVSGLVGVALLVLVLATALVSDRRATPFALARARGASPFQLASVAAVQAFVVTAPAAALGVVVGSALLPADVGSISWLHAAVCCGLVMGAAAVGAVRTGRPTRTLQHESGVPPQVARCGRSSPRAPCWRSASAHSRWLAAKPSRPTTRPATRCSQRCHGCSARSPR